MNLSLILNVCVICALFVISKFLLVTIAKRNWNGNGKLFTIKKILDCIVYCLSFVIVVYVNIFLNIFGRSYIIWFMLLIIIFICFAIKNLYIFSSQLAYFHKMDTISDKRNLLKIIITLMIGILMSLATINYAIYIFNPSFYKIQGDLSLVETAFEFIYYTFTLAITYSSSSISAAHILTKIIQMCEISYCYIVFGIIIVNLISMNNKE